MIIEMRIIGAATLLAVVLPATALTAQTLAPPVRNQELTANASVGAGYDDDVFAEGGQSLPVIGPPIKTSGGYGLADLGLAYSATGRRINFGAGANSAFRFYRLEEPFTAKHYGGSAGISVGLTERLRMTASLAGQRSSQHIFWIFPFVGESPLGQVSLLRVDYSLSSTAGRSYDANAGMSYALTRRSALTADYGYGTARYGDAAFELERKRWAGRYTYGFTRYASLRLGYGVEEAEYSAGRRFRRRLIDVGIDYARPLSFSRRTTLSFGTGTVALDDGESTFYTLTGRATLNHELSRRWVLQAAYIRDVGFINGFLEPFQLDSAVLNGTGRFGRRVQLTVSAAYSKGNIGFSRPAQEYQTYTGAGRVQVLLTRGLAAFGEYIYYNYRFDELVTLPLNSPRSLNRNGVRGGLNYRVAVF